MGRRFSVPNKFIFPSVLSACAALGELEMGKRSTRVGSAKDFFFWGLLLMNHMLCGDLDEAEKEFTRMPIHNVVSWTAIISGFVQKDDSFSAIDIFQRNEICKDASVGSSLVVTYSKCGGIEDCCKAFEQIDKPDLISCTALITSYAQHGKLVEALKVYELKRKEGNRPASVTFVEVLSAYSHNGLVEDGYFHFNSMAKD
ncbi:hypothetical protein Ddye_002594 [Dipteronia dyeriana]|uniref:Pentatricopeptide repeat-containing protein n=1 Tax=Dipteronia dyeriana TaxID=168575 RepID=A0AAD9XR30_9ROSI|nr:hypothetical protein Ddye_002594 [Dipteronia dyeriana]